MSDVGARIVDRSYRPYDGERLGASHSIGVLVRHGVERALGRRRTVWAKLLALAVIAMSFLPAIVFVGLAALLPQDDLRDLVLPSYGEYYGFVTTAIVLFSAFVAPELLCTDRRSGMLGLYLASPLSRRTYLAARAGAVGIVLAIVTLGPPLLLLIALTLQGAGPDGPGGVALVFVRILGAGVGVAAPTAALSLAVASTTDRRAAASAGVILVLLVSSAAANTLISGAGVPDEVGLFDLFGLPFEVATRIHGEANSGSDGLPAVSTPLVLGAAVVWTAAFAGYALWRHDRMQVRR